MSHVSTLLISSINSIIRRDSALKSVEYIDVCSRTLYIRRDLKFEVTPRFFLINLYSRRLPRATHAISKASCMCLAHHCWVSDAPDRLHLPDASTVASVDGMCAVSESSDDGSGNVPSSRCVACDTCIRTRAVVSVMVTRAQGERMSNDDWSLAVANGSTTSRPVGR